jgi:NAD(P)-dependent dehydrogenase (short-subunit alcohol dehydrogenase family)
MSGTLPNNESQEKRKKRRAVFLAAPASDYLTGQTIIVDGGYRTA